MTCRHTMADMDTACAADGLCPICLLEDVKRLRAALADLVKHAITTDSYANGMMEKQVEAAKAALQH